MQYSFEFDEAKSRANKKKHGIDFVEAQDLWLDGNLLRIAARSESEGPFRLCGTAQREALVGDRHLPGRNDQAHLGTEVAPLGGGGV